MEKDPCLSLRRECQLAMKEYVDSGEKYSPFLVLKPLVNDKKPPSFDLEELKERSIKLREAEDKFFQKCKEYFKCIKN